MRIGHTELFVRDVLASRDFYVNVLGFELVAEQGPEGQPPRYIWLGCGGREILLRPAGEYPPSPAASYQQSSAAIVLYCDDIQETSAVLQNRGLQFEGDDGPGCLTFTDLDGNWFQLVDHGN